MMRLADISQPTTIGELERRAGVADRAAFWRPFASSAEGFQLGVAELRRRVAERPNITCEEIPALAPAGATTAGPRACRLCGCTDDRACMTEAGPCWWVEADLCSACTPEEEGP